MKLSIINIFMFFIICVWIYGLIIDPINTLGWIFFWIFFWLAYYTAKGIIKALIEDYKRKIPICASCFTKITKDLFFSKVIKYEPYLNLTEKSFYHPKCAVYERLITQEQLNKLLDKKSKELRAYVH